MVRHNRHGHRRGGSRGYQQRRTNVREVRQRFLIVCEGEKTEPNYFRSFRVPGLVILVRGFGISPRQLVAKALALRDEDDYDQVWCVFDRDDCGADDFNGAIQQAQSHEVQIAYSNQAFELWYLLHFHYYNTPMSRQDYMNKLPDLLGRPYRKNDGDIYDLLYARQPDALANAERLLSQYSPLNPATDDPSTSVYLLVRQLNRFVPGRAPDQRD